MPISSVNDRSFPGELTEKADWKSMSEYWLHSKFGKTLTWVIGGNFGAYTFIVSLPFFLNFCLPFWMLILRNFCKQTPVFDKPTRVVLFEFIQQSSAKCRG